MLIHVFASSSVADQTAVFYYVLGMIVIIIGGIGGGYRIYQRQKKKWTEEGEIRAKQARAMEENSSQLKDNTAAITRLTSQFAEFMMRVTTELNGMGRRIGRLEDFHKDKGGV